jgi:hypothetical protein
MSERIDRLGKNYIRAKENTGALARKKAERRMHGTGKRILDIKWRPAI